MSSIRPWLVATCLLSGCAATSAELQRLPPLAVVSIQSTDVVRLARCVQYEMVSNRSENGPFLLGVGYKSEMMDNGRGEATVWGPSQGFPFYSAQFKSGFVSIHAQSLPTYSAEEIAKSLAGVVVMCDQNR